MDERDILARELEKDGNKEFLTVIHLLRDPKWNPHGMWPAILAAISEGYVQGRNYTHDHN